MAAFATVRRVIFLYFGPPSLPPWSTVSCGRLPLSVRLSFLVSARAELATAYIVGRVEVSDFGVAIAYSSALIILWLWVSRLFKLVVGNVKSAVALRLSREVSMTISAVQPRLNSVMSAAAMVQVVVRRG